MIINGLNLRNLFTGYSALFDKGVEGAPRYWDRVAMKASSSTSSNTYAWLGQLPSMREWVGDRVIRNLRAHSYTIEDVLFESTIQVPRRTIEDDQHGTFAPLFSEMGQQAGEHPDQLIFSLLARGFSELCFDGQYFFDADHPVNGPDGAVTSVSNMQAGTDPAWFLLDCSRVLKPLIFQERLAYKLTALDNETDENTFRRDEFLYGVRARVAAGYGLWQLAFGSKAPLTAENYEAARLAMRSFTGDEGRPLNIRPDTLVVPPALEGDARRLVTNATRVVSVGDPATPVAVDNEWAGSAEAIVTAWLNT